MAKQEARNEGKPRELMDLPDYLLLDILSKFPHVSWLGCGGLNSRCRRLVIKKALESPRNNVILLYAAKGNLIGVTKALLISETKPNLKVTLNKGGKVFGAAAVKVEPDYLIDFKFLSMKEDEEDKEPSEEETKDNPEHLTPLSLACLHKSNDVARLLFDAGADVNAFHKEGATPVDFAVKASNAELVEMMAPKVDVNSFSIHHEMRKILHRAVSTKYVNQAAMKRIVTALIDAGSDVNAHRLVGYPWEGAQSLLTDAVANGSCSLETIKLLLEKGAKADEIFECYWRGDVSDGIFSYLARRPAKTAANQEEAVEIAKLLVDNGAQIKGLKCSWSPLCDAIRRKHTALAVYLIEQGIDVNGRTNHRRLDDEPALYSCVSKGDDYLPISKMLIERGADVYGYERFGDTVLDKAAELGALETVRLLLDSGANVENNPGGFDGGGNRTPIMYTKSLPIVKLLLERGADANAMTGAGQSVLHFLAMYSEKPDMLEAMKLVLEHGGDPLKHRKSDQNAFEYCSKWRKWNMAELMANYMPEKAKAAAEQQLAEARLAEAQH